MNKFQKEIQQFKKVVMNYYMVSGRHVLPWRKKISAYKVWVSEIMLQQTQVDRVIPFFENWMSYFPDIQTLANASQVDILKHWKGLGYNSRALRMKQCAKEILNTYNGVFPKTTRELELLPGIGPYTAGAISAFAYNQSTVIIETNIRRVFIHHFFQDRENVSDQEILELVEKTLPQENFREWYWALMDYGSYLGRTLNIAGKKYNPNVQSKHYSKQSKFIGSDRQIRGKILEILLQEKDNVITLKNLEKKLTELSSESKRIQKIVEELSIENFIIIRGKKIELKK